MARRRRPVVEPDPAGEAAQFARYRLAAFGRWSRPAVEAMTDAEVTEELERLDAEREEETGGEAS